MFTVAALLEFALVIVIQRANSVHIDFSEFNIAPKNDRLAFIDQKTNNEGIHMRNVIRQRNAVADDSGKHDNKDLAIKDNIGPCFPSVSKIDYLAFWVYLVVYILFNTVYWFVYLN